MRALTPLALAALLTLAPATAQDAQPACPDGQVETPEGCSQQAWVDDCPPEHMCAAGSPDEPVQYGEDGCIECSGPGPVDAPVPADTNGIDESASGVDKEAPIVSAAILLVALVVLVAFSRRR